MLVRACYNVFGESSWSIVRLRCRKSSQQLKYRHHGMLVRGFLFGIAASRQSVKVIRSHLSSSSSPLSSAIMSAPPPATPPAPPIVIHSIYIEGARGIREHLRKLCPAIFPQCTFISMDESPLSEKSLESFRKAEVILMDTERLPALMTTVKNVKWVQSTWAGVDSFIEHVDPSLLPPPFTLTRFAGVFGAYMAEYVIGCVIAHERSLRMLWECQQKKHWATKEYAEKGYSLLKGRTMAVIGAGDIGTEIGRVCKAVNMRVIGLVRRDVPKDQRDEAFDEYRTSKDLPYLLAEADFIVNVLPSTKETIDFLSGEVLSHCTKKPVFINVGRGNVISEDSVVNAIKKGWISHAILDVTQPEPLPQDSPLWTMPEVTITPHVSALSYGPEVCEVFSQNYERYIKGEPLKHQLDWAARY